MWQLQDGPEQELPDRALSRDDFKEGARSNVGSDLGNPDPWSNKDFQTWFFGNDSFKETNEALDHMNNRRMPPNFSPDNTAAGQSEWHRPTGFGFRGN